MNPKNLRPSHGFTLLELLIALALLGLMLTLLFGGLRLATRSWDAAQGAMDTADNVRAVEGFLRRELADIRPYSFRSAAGQRLAFLGHRDGLYFVAPLPTRIGLAGPRMISVRFERDEAGWRLVWRERPFDASQPDFSALGSAPPMVLLNTELGNVEDFALSYYGQQGGAVGPSWSEQWEDAVRLPRLIKVHVRLKGGQPWPDFIVAPLFARSGP
jgi:general secretion pathway protein J